MAYNEDSSASGHDEPWIQWFCGLKGHEMFCEVERAYIEDGFNLYGLRACVSNFSDCLDLILDRISPDDSDDSHLTQSACILYGLIHARYIITAHGLDAMYNKYAAKEFGTCPLLQCNVQAVLPVGLKDEVGVDTVKVFCPKCENIYHPPPSRSRGGSGQVDGASFGTTFPHLFLMTFNNLIPEPLSPNQAYVPRVFGFRVHQSARQKKESTQVAKNSSSSGPENINSFSASKKSSDGARLVFSAINSLPSLAESTTISVKSPPMSIVECTNKKPATAQQQSTLVLTQTNKPNSEQIKEKETKPEVKEGTAASSKNNTTHVPDSNVNESSSVEEEIGESEQKAHEAYAIDEEPTTTVVAENSDQSHLKKNQKTVLSSSTNTIKRKLKTGVSTTGASASESNENGSSGKGANTSEQKCKSKRPKRSGNGVT